MAKRREVVHATLADTVLKTIRDQILAGRYTAGTKLDQQTLAGELGVSVIPIRESLRQLETEGLVRIYPYRGAFIAKLSVEELQQIYTVRECLEQLAAQLAVSQFSQHEVEQLETIFNQMESATQAWDFAGLFKLNRSFHFTIYEAASNSVLLQMISSLWDRSSVYRRTYTYMPDRALQALEEHRAILAACKAGDSAAAGHAVRENVRQTTEGILRQQKTRQSID